MIIKVTSIKEYLKREKLKSRFVRAEELPYKLKHITRNGLVDKTFPDYLFLGDRKVHLFFKFHYDLLLTEVDKNKYFEDMLFYFRILSRRYHAVIFILVDSIAAADSVLRYKRSSNKNQFIKILFFKNNGFLDYEQTTKFNLQGRILDPVLRELKNCTRIKGSAAKCIKKFAIKYLKAYDNDLEELPIGEFIKDLLVINSSCRLKSTHIDFMAYIEKALSEMGPEAARDHYYHACNTLLIGFLIIEKYYSKFKNVLLKKSRIDDIEGIWTIISLFHDIGYPMEKLPIIICEAAGLDKEHVDKIAKYLIKFRKDCWRDIKIYKDATLLLDNMYSYLANNKKYNLFSGKNRISNQDFYKGIESAFVQHGYHGVVSAINLALAFAKIKGRGKNKKEFNILFKYLIYSCVSILWHDWKTRDSFKNITKIRASDFPLAYLLTYIDVLQEDRREFGNITKPDIFEGVETDNSGAIVAILNRNELQSNDRLRDRLCNDLTKALNFYTTDDIRFEIPAALSSEAEMIEKDGIRNLERREALLEV